MTAILIVEATPAALIAKGRYDFAAVFPPVLRALDASLRIARTNPYDTPLTPDALDTADAVIFAGSSVDWSTDAAEAAPLSSAMEAAFRTGKPVWGSCNGMQLAAVVLGGAVRPSPNGTEIGLARDIRLTEAGQRHPMLAGRRSGFAAACAHFDEVAQLPSGAAHLASNAHSPVQAFAYAQDGVDFMGTQYHPELRARQVAGILHTTGENPALAERLEAADSDARVAKALGTTPEEQTLRNHSIELANWLRHIAAAG